MAKYVIEDTTLTNTANAIREKTGKTDTITPSNFATEIASIQSGGGDTTQEDGLIDGTLTEYSNDRVTKIRRYCFEELQNLTSVNLPNVTTIDTKAFCSCRNLINVNIPKLEKIENEAFSYCSNLTSLNLSNVTEIGQRVFYKTKLINISCPKLTTAESECFSNCTQAKTINLPLITYLSNYSFRSCSSLTSITLPKAFSIGYYSFSDCYALTKADFSALQEVEQGLFSSCTKLDTLIIRTETMCTLENTNAIQDTLIKKGTGYIYVPSALIEEYKVATNWVTYANQFRAIEDYPEICGEVA